MIIQILKDKIFQWKMNLELIKSKLMIKSCEKFSYNYNINYILKYLNYNR